MPKMKTETIEFGGEKMKIKEGALRKQLKLKKGDKFTKTMLNRLSKIPDGERFDFKGNSFKMTKLMKRRIGLAKAFAKSRKK